MTHLRGPAGRLAWALTIALLLAGAVTASGPVAASVAACGSWTGAQPPSPSTMDNVLDGVVVLTPCDAWAVGTYFNGTAEQGFILHWNGQKWAIQTIPNPGGTAHDTSLNAVAANGASGKAWAVGFYNNGTSDKTLILAWTGTKWAQQPSPTPGNGAFLDGAATTAAGNAWAVGSSNNGTTSVVLHWNGTTWAQEASPNPGPETGLFAVAASSASNAWAVGRFANGSDLDQNLAIHCC